MCLDLSLWIKQFEKWGFIFCLFHVLSKSMLLNSTKCAVCLLCLWTEEPSCQVHVLIFFLLNTCIKQVHRLSITYVFVYILFIYICKNKYFNREASWRKVGLLQCFVWEFRKRFSCLTVSCNYWDVLCGTMLVGVLGEVSREVFVCHGSKNVLNKMLKRKCAVSKTHQRYMWAEWSFCLVICLKQKDPKKMCCIKNTPEISVSWMKLNTASHRATCNWI